MSKCLTNDEEVLTLIPLDDDPARYKTLVEIYLRAKDAYYNHSPFLRDSTFDLLESKIQEMNPKEPALDFVGAPIREKDKSSHHSTPMLSTDKALDKEVLVKWAQSEDRKSHDLVGTAKLDGVACDLYYENGSLVRASSRGNGILGSDITAKMRYVVPGIINTEVQDLHIRGEVVISFENFERLNQLLTSREEDEMSNPRNAAAGIVITEDALDIEKLSCLSFVAYRIIGQKHSTFQEELKTLTYLEFEVPKTTITNLSHLVTDATQWDSARAVYEFPCDGVVYRLDDEATFEEMGTTSKFHRGAVAYKFPPDVCKVVLIEVKWSCGSREITPIAHFNPVFLDGAVISKAALHSVRNMIAIGAVPGETLELRRSGQVIPWLQRVGS